jgi:hypothetical protein
MRADRVFCISDEGKQKEASLAQVLRGWPYQQDLSLSKKRCHAYRGFPVFMIIMHIASLRSHINRSGHGLQDVRPKPV